MSRPMAGNHGYYSQRQGVCQNYSGAGRLAKWFRQRQLPHPLLHGLGLGGWWFRGFFGFWRLRLDTEPCLKLIDSKLVCSDHLAHGKIHIRPSFLELGIGRLGGLYGK